MSPALSRRQLLTLDRCLIVLSAAGFFLVLVTLIVGGFSIRLPGIRFSSHGVLRPLALALAALALAAGRSERRANQIDRVWRGVERHARAVAIVAAIAAFVTGLRYGTFIAGGSDSFGYISEANLWLTGHLVTPEPLATVAPWPDPDWSFAPLGYRPGPTRGTIVPTYAAGLPLVMAGFRALFGANGVFYVVPVLGALAVWLTFVLGRRVDGALTGAAAAMLLAASPIFLFQLVVPMSDVPVTAWWLLALVLLTGARPAAAFYGGLASSAALLTRPNLFPLVVVLAGFTMLLGDQPRLRRLMLYGLGVAPGCMAIAWINRTLYGSPIKSGYGSLSTIFSLEGFTANLVRYPTWILESQTIFICLALAAPWLLRRRDLMWLLLAVSAALFVCYAFYTPFDSWLYLRFLLPAIPLLVILSTAVAMTVLRRTPWKWQALATVALVGLTTGWYWDTSVNRGFAVQKAGEQHFAEVGAFVSRQLPQRAIVLAVMHSGSVRHYSGRMTLRWDALPSEWLDPALDFLKSKGYVPYLIFDPWEEAQFRSHFAGHSALAALDWPPAATIESSGTQVYDPADRARFLAGEQLRPHPVGPLKSR